MAEAVSAKTGHSATCCAVPPVVSEGYVEKGQYKEIGGFNTYTTGVADSKKGVISIFDIFGLYPQTIQGMDILGSDNLVLLPDWFKGAPADISFFPPDTPEKSKTLTEFLTLHAPQKYPSIVKAYLAEAKKAYPSVEKWAVIGLCWGGKVVAQLTKPGEEDFAVGVQIHPAFVDPEEAKGVTKPILMLASKDEDAEAVKGFEANLEGPKHVETYADQHHGWMGARSNLKDARNKEEFARGYKKVSDFLKEHL